MTTKADTGTRTDALPFGRDDRPAAAIPATAVGGIPPSRVVGDVPIVQVVKKAPSHNDWYAQIKKNSIGEAPDIKEEVSRAHNPIRQVSQDTSTNFGRSGPSPGIWKLPSTSAVDQAVQKGRRADKEYSRSGVCSRESEVYVSNSSDHNGLSHNGQNEGVADSRSVSQAVRVANGVNSSRSTQSTLIYIYVRGRLAEVAELVAQVLKYYGHEFVLVNRKGSREYRTAGEVEAISELADKKNSESGPATVGSGLAHSMWFL